MKSKFAFDNKIMFYTNDWKSIIQRDPLNFITSDNVLTVITIKRTTHIEIILT